MSDIFTHRSFIGIFPPQHILEYILSVQSALKTLLIDIRWEHEQKFHITLQFWGNQREDVLKRLQEKISLDCSSIENFSIVLTKVGTFPNRRTPNIFWIGSDIEENHPVVTLAENIQKIAQEEGIILAPKPFHPHITLGRRKHSFYEKKHSSLIQNIETVTFNPIAFRCSEIRIMKGVLGHRNISEPAQPGSTYSTLYTIPLK